jgi:hypothetical protein
MGKQFVVAFKEADDRSATPELYLCSAEESDAIGELLGKVLAEGDGPINTVSDRDFVEPIKTITLAELSERFAEELEAAEFRSGRKGLIEHQQTTRRSSSSQAD